MNHYKKTVLGSIVTFILGTSCCWLSSIAIWVGGATFIGAIVKFIENIQTQLILISLTLGIFSIYLYQKNRERKAVKKKE